MGVETMNPMEAYFVLLRVLQHCYRICGEDRLGAALGAMDPDLWVDKRPMDLKVYHEWTGYGKFRDLKPENSVQVICGFLTYLERTDPYYAFPETIEVIKSVTDEEWKAIFHEAKETCTAYRF